MNLFIFPPILLFVVRYKRIQLKSHMLSPTHQIEYNTGQITVSLHMKNTHQNIFYLIQLNLKVVISHLLQSAIFKDFTINHLEHCECFCFFFSGLTTKHAAKSLQLCPTLRDPHRRQPTRLPRPWDSPGKNTGVGCPFLLQCRKVKRESEDAQSCSTLSDPMDCSLPGSSAHGIFQAGVLEWGAIAFSDHKA